MSPESVVRTALRAGANRSLRSAMFWLAAAVLCFGSATAIHFLLLIPVLIFGALGVSALRNSIRKRSPLPNALNFFALENPDKAVETLLQQLKSPHTARITSDSGQVFFITVDWFAVYTPTDFNAVRRDDVMWVYDLVDEVRLWDRYNRQMIIRDDVQSVWNAIQHLVPWAIYGFSRETQQRWSRDRAAFIQNVTQRRAELTRNSMLAAQSQMVLNRELASEAHPASEAQ